MEHFDSRDGSGTVLVISPEKFLRHARPQTPPAPRCVASRSQYITLLMELTHPVPRVTFFTDALTCLCLVCQRFFSAPNLMDSSSYENKFQRLSSDCAATICSYLSVEELCRFLPCSTRVRRTTTLSFNIPRTISLVQWTSSSKALRTPPLNGGFLFRGGKFPYLKKPVRGGKFLSFLRRYRGGGNFRIGGGGMFSKRGNTLERHFRANLPQYFPQNRQFFFARAFGARGILAIRWWGERAKNEPFVRKRSWRILSI